MRGFVVVAILVAVLTGCMRDTLLVEGGAPSPTSEPPTLTGVPSRPPPAWIETDSGSWWMAYGSYCWDRACVDIVSPEARDIPLVAVREGEEVTFHLGFTPSELQLFFMADDDSSLSLPAERQVTWKVTRGGILSLLARDGSPGGDAAYEVELTIQEDS